jgi:hypothetical protein
MSKPSVELLTVWKDLPEVYGFFLRMQKDVKGAMELTKI